MSFYLLLGECALGIECLPLQIDACNPKRWPTMGLNSGEELRLRQMTALQEGWSSKGRGMENSGLSRCAYE